MCVAVPNKILFSLFIAVLPVQLVKVLFAEKTMNLGILSFSRIFMMKLRQLRKKKFAGVVISLKIIH